MTEEKDRLQYFLDGSSEDLDLVRAELRLVLDQVGTILETYDELHYALIQFAILMDIESQRRLESFHPDEWIHAYTIGEANAVRRTAALFFMLGSAMKLRELPNE